MELSIVILAMTTTEALFKMTSNCLSSLIASETDIDMEIIVIESNKNYLNSGFEYPEFVKVITPEADFNFHKFLNIGIKASKGDYIALCNNDLIFYKNWFSEILKVKEENPSIKSFSPNGKIDDYSFDKTYELGYKVRTHIMGSCIIANKEIFPKINFLDETFDFNYADNDYAMTLKKYNIKHALVNASKVEHLDKKESQKIKGDYSKIFKVEDGEVKKIPDYLLKSKDEWILSDDKGLSDYLKFHNKWGKPGILYKKSKITDFLIKIKFGFLNRFVLNS